MPPIKQGQWWLYAGSYERFRGVRHLLAMVEQNEISAWSDPSHKNEEGSNEGHSWRGTPRQFLLCFRPIEDPLQPA